MKCKIGQREQRTNKPPRSQQGFILMLFLAANTVTFAANTEIISNDLLKAANVASANATADVIVQFRRPPADADLQPILMLGGSVKRTFRHIPAALVQLPLRALNGIAAHPHVLYVSPDRRIEGKLEFAGPAVGADITYSNGWTGTGVAIAILDSGIDPEHPDIKGRIVRSENFVPSETTTADPYGHGTHVAIAAAGNAYASTGNSYTVTFRGIAPRANIVNLRVLDSNGYGSDSSVIAAIDRAIELKSVHNIRVLNLSLGRGIADHYTVDPLCSAVERAWKAGIVVVVAAGNNGRNNSMGTAGYGTISSPANSPYAITVGAMKDMGTATRSDDLMTSYSSKGPTLLDQIVKPDLVAPGNLVIAGVPSGAGLRTQLPENVVPVSYYKASSTLNTSSVYFRLSGTSVATPIVSGAAALILQKTPELTPDQVKARLMKTATKSFPNTSASTDPVTGITYNVTYDLFTVGAGYLDIPAALANTDASSGSATSPRALYDASNGSTTIVFDSESLWNNAVIWGSAVVWGSNVILNGNAVVWGSAVIWGSQTSAGFAVIWGSGAVATTSNPFPLTISANGEK